MPSPSRFTLSLMSVSVVLRCSSALRPFLAMHASVETILHRAGVSLKPLHCGQADNLGTKLGESPWRGLNDTHPLEEIIDTQWGRETRGSASGQDMVRSGDVVAKRFGRQ